MRKSLLILAIVLMAGALLYDRVYSNPAPSGRVTTCTIPQHCYWSVPNGAVAPMINGGLYNQAYSVISNNTIDFDVSGQESAEPVSGLTYDVNTTGTMTLVFHTGIAPVVTCTCIKVISGTLATLTFSPGLSLSVFTISWLQPSVAIEQPAVLFLDDFLTGTIATNNWVLDSYVKTATPAGIYTSAGYLVMAAQPASSVESVHSLNAAFSPAQYSGQNIVVKRKLTFALYPFSQSSASSTASLHLGLSPLLTTGAFPGTSVFGTPAGGAQNNGCNLSANASDNIGANYFYVDNTGYIEADTCGDPSGTKTSYALETGDPTAYTILTIETYGLFCSICTDNVHPGIAWVWFRAYQEDAANNIIAGTDKTVNATANVAPYFQKTYIFASQANSDSAVTRETTFVDLVQMQNYGSPVCLFGCIPPIAIVGGPFDSLWNSFVAFAQYIGFGDLGMGSFFLFIIISGAVITPTWIKLESMPIVIIEFVSISAMFILSGLMGSIWLFAILGADAVIAYMIINKLFLGGGRPGGGSPVE